jgi:hypothetical protein
MFEASTRATRLSFAPIDTQTFGPTQSTYRPLGGIFRSHGGPDAGGTLTRDRCASACSRLKSGRQSQIGTIRGELNAVCFLEIRYKSMKINGLCEMAMSEIDQWHRACFDKSSNGRTADATASENGKESATRAVRPATSSEQGRGWRWERRAHPAEAGCLDIEAA